MTNKTFLEKHRNNFEKQIKKKEELKFDSNFCCSKCHKIICYYSSSNKEKVINSFQTICSNCVSDLEKGKQKAKEEFYLNKQLEAVAKLMKMTKQQTIKDVLKIIDETNDYRLNFEKMTNREQTIDNFIIELNKRIEKELEVEK